MLQNHSFSDGSASIVSFWDFAEQAMTNGQRHHVSLTERNVSLLPGVFKLISGLISEPL